MPFRFLLYIARLLENTVTDKAAAYHKKRVELQCHGFYVAHKSAVIYNGLDTFRP
jgi:hypothetical protein